MCFIYVDGKTENQIGFAGLLENRKSSEYSQNLVQEGEADMVEWNAHVCGIRFVQQSGTQFAQTYKQSKRISRNDSAEKKKTHCSAKAQTFDFWDHQLSFSCACQNFQNANFVGRHFTKITFRKVAWRWNAQCSATNPWNETPKVVLENLCLHSIAIPQ